MKSIEQIYKANKQDPSLINTPGKFVFNAKAGCKVYMPAFLSVGQKKKGKKP